MSFDCCVTLRGRSYIELGLPVSGKDYFMFDMFIKAGVNLDADFPPLNMSLTEIFRSRFKQSMLITILCFGVFCKFLAEF